MLFRSKQPVQGSKYIFRKGEPYAQILILPKKVDYKIMEMSTAEKIERNNLDNKSSLFVKNRWADNKGNVFDDKYKNMGCIFAKEGIKEINNIIQSKTNIKIKINKKRPILNRGKNNKKCKSGE